MPRPTRLIGILGLLCLVSCQRADRPPTIVDVAPAAVAAAVPADEEARIAAMIASYRRCGPVHVMTFPGDFDDLLRFHHLQILQQFQLQGSRPGFRTGCSMFRHGGGPDDVVVGRNFDNVDTDVLAGWFLPEDGYASLTLVPMFELGFGREHPFDPQNPADLRRLTYAPMVSVEGVNERGLSVTVASLARRQVEQLPDRRPRFMLHLIREMLDRAADIDEAVAIAERYNVFDNAADIMSHHLFVADRDHGSVVLEWRDGRMHVIPAIGDRQVVTNSALLDVSEDRRRERCDRYRRLDNCLAEQQGPFGWREAMAALAKAKQVHRRYVIDGRALTVSTQWSAVFDLHSLSTYLCLHHDYGTVYRLPAPGAAAATTAAGR